MILLRVSVVKVCDRWFAPEYHTSALLYIIILIRTRSVWCIGKNKACPTKPVATEWIRSWEDPPSPHLFGGRLSWKFLILPCSCMMYLGFLHSARVLCRTFAGSRYTVLVVLSASSIWLVSEQVDRFVRVWLFFLFREQFASFDHILALQTYAFSFPSSLHLPTCYFCRCTWRGENGQDGL